MKANELRIGNWVKIDDGIGRVIALSSFEHLGLEIKPEPNQTVMVGDKLFDYPESELSPIRLSEEILIKCGFRKVNHINGFSFYTLSNSKKNKAHIDIYDHQTIYFGYHVSHCKYLHQLQNLFFALMGEEIKIEL